MRAIFRLMELVKLHTQYPMSSSLNAVSTAFKPVKTVEPLVLKKAELLLVSVTASECTHPVFVPKNLCLRSTCESGDE